ncbi:MAG: IS110 family transposase [Acidobacteria bacterium]|nr:IS110 family transposase [Acidobacteriota bacterium]
MFYIGIDVHKKFLSLNVKDETCATLWRRKLSTGRVEPELCEMAQRFAPCKVVFEASGSAEWLIDLLRPLTQEVVLAHPGRLRIISQTVKKTDKIDAAILAELLAKDYIPRAYIASAAEREDRALVRGHRYLSRLARGAKQRVRAALARHNWLEPTELDLWTRAGRAWLLALAWPAKERLELEATLAVLDGVLAQQRPLDRQVEQRAQEHEGAGLLRSIPHLGPLTALAIVAILGQIERFSSQGEVAAWVGLVPRVDQSAARCHLGHITCQGNGYLRGLLVEAAWRLIRQDDDRRKVFEAIARRRGRKIAIVATARRLLGIAVAMLRSGRRYGEKDPRAQAADRAQAA